jgi:anti-sigma regulatory factor (Ser/Thr protein kinase)
VRVHRRDGVDVLFVTGPLEDTARDLVLAVPLCLSDDPQAVVCDLSDADCSPKAKLPSCFGQIASLARDWPGIPVAVAASRSVCTRLAARTEYAGLLLQESFYEALAAVRLRPTPPTATRQLPPHPTAARAARDFLADQLLDWKLPKALTAGSLVMSELVTNAMIYARSEIEVSLARHESLVRIAVRDAGQGVPQPRDPGADSTGGRGLVLVDGFARAWGVLPSARRGKVVWAVVDG